MAVPEWTLKDGPRLVRERTVDIRQESAAGYWVRVDGDVVAFRRTLWGARFTAWRTRRRLRRGLHRESW